MEPVVRPVAEAEHGATADLIASVYIGEGFSAETARDTLRDVASRAAHARVFVAVDASGAILGTATLVPHGTPSSQIAAQGEMEVRLVAVSPASRGRGIGELLMNICISEARARGAAMLVLSTQTTMEAAQRLYSRLGFTRQPGRDWVRSSGPTMLVYALPLI